MARRKNVKRIDPRYFMDEKTHIPLNEAGGAADPVPVSPLSSTEPGKRIKPFDSAARPGLAQLKKQIEDKDKHHHDNLQEIAKEMADADELAERIVDDALRAYIKEHIQRVRTIVAQDLFLLGDESQSDYLNYILDLRRKGLAEEVNEDLEEEEID